MEEIPIFAINAYMYCPYRYYIEYVKGQFVTNDHVEEGRYLGNKKEKKAQSKNYKKKPQVYVSSNKYGLYGFVDELIIQKEKITIVETKKGNAVKPFENDVLQLLAYMVCYSETFDTDLNKINGKLVYLGSGKSFEISPKNELIEKLGKIVKSMRELCQKVPEPQYIKKKCDPCSLLNICMPEKSTTNGEILRKVTPSSYDAKPIFVCTQGAYVSRFGESIQITCHGEELLRLHSSAISTLYVLGNVQVSTQALKLLTSSGVPVVFTDQIGRNSFVCFSGFSKNINLRIKQLETLRDKEKRLIVAKQILNGKLRNQLFVLKRKLNASQSEINRFKQLIQSINECENIDELMGIEGICAGIYFETMAKRIDPIWGFDGRNRRPPADPVNVLLSLGYTLLHNTVLSVLLGVGFDPLIGVLHSEHYGRFSLSLDLMEEFRPLIIDQTVISMINLKQIKPSNFVKDIENCYRLKESGMKKFVEAYKERLETKHYHPLFKTAMEYIRIIDVQARVFEKFILGEIDNYIPFVVSK